MKIRVILKKNIYLAASRIFPQRSLLLPTLVQCGLGVAIFVESIWWDRFLSAILQWTCIWAHDISYNFCITPICSLGLWIFVSPSHMVSICLCYLPAIVIQGQVLVFLFLPPGYWCSSLPLPPHLDRRGSLPPSPPLWFSFYSWFLRWSLATLCISY